MDNKAIGRLALTIATAIAFAALTTKPLHACDSATGCQSSISGLMGVLANALPTSPKATDPKPAEETAEAPMVLKKFTKSRTRATRRAQSRKAATSQEARKSKIVPLPAERDQDAEASGRTKQGKIDPAVANAKAELVTPETDKIKASPSQRDAVDTGSASAPQPAVAAPAAAETAPTAPSPPAVQLVSADEFNELDRAAWEKNQLPKLLQLTASDSRAELSENDSKWAQTSTIGKLFVAFGALLTIGSAIRMFLA